ncbi:5-bromo-4-chloroindolyl phosphate hydrolysis family protein [Staphylococcus carnosus]|uniref:5-bromo-4-chloroindolyl phosphate hydrolase n=2 Tax=Staphylococcus carnosus TaxID=1281 RepID=A0AAJ0JS74_STACA|nr:5-bromo-4-chloroindolyl phosphate hydrolysis family protein [Staphylococcus carnosus]KKB26302.1 5-bromo-4-chloroindolyl phosphate hydrolase [Staphylococcus carnosus]KOR13680.1 5-bromo-4-chloroindolyl phosphate hydrolase [Staphylococcus carnosus]PNZ96983.1 5-bromo-4-chloroindolyl phosphate hydrolase [Staphylococcus carnosus]QPT04091.1 5-bromo-4-chloroindolyl phosphate hydrolysis family protein [Staphylococcus carnosus]QQS85265.1 5-bromo-4-chloroindolyl phosphate hydrolysis family protein [St
MRYYISRIYGTLLGVPAAIVAWVTSLYAFDISFIYDFGIGIAAFFALYVPTQLLTSKQYLKEIGLTRRDFRFVRHQLGNAQMKIRKLLRSFINVRSIKDFKQVNEIHRLARTIYFTVKQQPQKFFIVDSFFYSHLDNALNLIESYTRLSRMPGKSKEEKQKLEQTRITLDEVKRTLVADLKRLNEDDYNRLDVEMEMNRIEQNRK